MSKISLTPNAAGTGTFNIAAPGTNTNRTLTLPDSSGTVAITSQLIETDVQTFDASGTWDKPAFGSMARIQVWGGGGGGGRGNATIRQTGGGGGGYNEITVPLSTLASSVSVTVGAGGAGRSGSTGVGSSGGTSSFGTLIYAYGGGGGAGSTTNTDNYTTGGGGGQISAGAAGVPGATIRGLVGRPAMTSGADNGMGIWSGGTGVASTYSGVLSARGDALFGGGAGAFASIASSQGSSVYGGNGGDRNATGSAPGGGGGPSSSLNGNGFAGAAGRVIVTVW
jgi:hypothetical protein